MRLTYFKDHLREFYPSNRLSKALVFSVPKDELWFSSHSVDPVFVISFLGCFRTFRPEVVDILTRYILLMVDTSRTVTDIGTAR